MTTHRRNRWRAPLRAVRPHARRASRPRAEALEDRALLSVYTVDTFSDNNDGNTGPGNLSLREAILLANAHQGADQINLATGAYTLSIAGANEDGGQTGDLDITDDLTIVGAGPGLTVVNANGLDRIFDIHGARSVGPAVAVTLSGLKLTGGRTPNISGSNSNNGGAIENYAGTLTVDNCLITNNTTGSGYYGGRGGGIDTVLGSLTITNTTLDGNTNGPGSAVGGMGGAVAGNASAITIRDSVVSNNTTGITTGAGTISAGRGGGLYSETGSLTVVRTAITGNKTGYANGIYGLGGGIYNYSGNALFVESSTITNNAAWQGGGVMYDNGVDGHILDSTIANNSANGGKGGGLYVTVSKVSLISGTTISGNTVTNANDYYSAGGGLYNDGVPYDSTVNWQIGAIVNTTITGNSISGNGSSPNSALAGGLYNAGIIGQIVNTTIAGNSAREAGGVYLMNYSNQTPTIGALVNTIIADNVASGNFPQDFEQLGAVTTASNNLIEAASGHTIANGVNGNIVGLDPKLAALADNGGPTRTEALLAGSPAIDAGLNAGAPSTDQRGQPRPSNGVVDIGAFEVQATANRPPQAADQSLSTNEDAALSGAVTATDPDNDPVTFAAVAQPAHGTLSLDPSTGAFTYTPAANYNGADSFTFKANDGQADGNVATVSITVNPVNDAPVAQDLAAAVDEDTLLTNKVNATDVDGDALTYTVVTKPAHGVVSMGTGGVFRYFPSANYNGPDSFTYKANDGKLDSNVATVSITVNPVNDPPNVSSPNLATDEDTPISGRVAVTDVEGDPYTVALDNAPGHGVATVNADGSFTYTPDPNYNGTDAFLVSATDNQGGVGFGIVTIKVRPVNDAPVAQGDRFGTSEDTPLVVGGGAAVTRLHMVSDRGDFIGNGLTYDDTPPGATFAVAQNFDQGAKISVTNPSNAGDFWFLNFAAPNNVLLAPGDYPNAARFPFQPAGSPGLDVSGQGRGSNTLTGAFTVYQADWAADGKTLLAFAAAFEQHTDGADPALRGTVQYNTRIGAGAGVLANDSDVDADLLTAVVVSGPAHGTLSLNPDGTFTYTPAPNFNGSDSFTYKASDGHLDSNVATVTIDVSPVNDPPVAQGDTATTDEDTPATIPVLANDSDVDGDPLTPAVVDGPAHGTATVNADGTITYTPAADYNGPDSFTYKVSDGQADSSVATVSITVTPVNDPPVARDDATATDEDTPVTISVLANDSDVDGDALAPVIVSAPARGAATVNADGTITYTPATNDNGTVTFTYKASDGQASSNVATVTITIRPVNDPPVALPQSLTATAGVPASGSVKATDVDGDSLAYAIVAQPAHGALTINPATGGFTYTASAGYSGADSFTFKANDGALDSNVAAVTITVKAGNHAPVADSQTTAPVAEDGRITITLTGNDNADGTPQSDLVFRLATAPTRGVLFDANGVRLAAGDLVAGTRTLTYQPAAGLDDLAGDAFTFTVADRDPSGPLTSAPATVTIPSFAKAVADGAATFDAATGILRVGGTAGNDVIDVAQVKVKGKTSVQVTLNGQVLSQSFAPSALREVRVWGRAGNDQISLSGLAVDALLVGGLGDDRLTGGDGSNLLLGGAGADTLTGGNGDDLLAGGAGADTASGVGGDDVLIGGTIGTPKTEAELRQFLADWSAGRNPDPATLGVIDPATEVDTLIGGTGNDLFLAGPNDITQDGKTKGKGHK